MNKISSCLKQAKKSIQDYLAISERNEAIVMYLSDGARRSK